MIIVTTTDHRTDEDCDFGSKITKILIDSFLRRPSMDDRAMQAIGAFANNGVLVDQGVKKEKMGCDCAAVFIFKGQARWMISGNSRVYHFENGKLARTSDPAEAPIFGSTPKYKVRLEEPFRLDAKENAFLLCSRELSNLISDEDLENALQESKTPEEWMNKIVGKAGESRQYCAITAFLPTPKRFLGLF